MSDIRNERITNLEVTGTASLAGISMATLSNTRTLAKAIRVALAGSASVRGPMVLDNANLDMGTNNFTIPVQKRITTTRPSATETLFHKHDGTTGLILELLTTGHLKLTINATTFTSTAALPSATNVEPVIMVPTVRETATTAGSVTFVVDGVQLGDALAISARVEKIVNGTFAADITGWTITTGSPGSIAWEAAGKLRVTRSGSTLAAHQAVSLAAGETLFVSCSATWVSGASARPALALRSEVTVSGGTTYTSQALAAAASGTLRVSYYAASAMTIYVHLQVGAADGVYDFDTVTSIDTYSVDNASNLYLLGTSTTTTEGDYLDSGIYNRALTVAECLYHSIRGPVRADGVVGTSIPSQTKTTSFTWSNYAGAPGFETFTTSGSDITSAINTSGLGIATAPITVTLGARYRLTVDITVNSGSVQIKSNSSTDLSSGGQAIATVTSADDGLIVREFVLSVSSSYIGFYCPGSGNFSTTGFTLERIGLCGHWPADGAQSNTGQIFDSSGNKNHAMLPASGATVIGKPMSEARQVRWTNTWTGTHELQYIGGTNQAILPANAYIESIVGVVSGATVEDIIIGDGSDTDRYVALTTGLAAGTVTFTLANRTTDGTNLKLTVDPDANATMSIIWTITYRILE